ARFGITPLIDGGQTKPTATPTQFEMPAMRWLEEQSKAVLQCCRAFKNTYAVRMWSISWAASTAWTLSVSCTKGRTPNSTCRPQNSEAAPNNYTCSILRVNSC